MNSEMNLGSKEGNYLTYLYIRVIQRRIAVIILQS